MSSPIFVKSIDKFHKAVFATMSHPFGDLITQFINRRRGLSQNKLAAGILQDSSVVSDMCNGKRLTGKQARERVVAIIRWFHDQQVLYELIEADALLASAGMSGLRSEDTDEATLLSVLNNNLTKQKHVQKTAQQMSVVPFMIPTLPPQGVFGRASDIRRIEEMLLLNEENVYAVMPVALRGMGGIGKTTLVTAFAHLPAIQSQFPDGVLWVALGPTPLIRGLLDLWGQALDIELRYEPHEEACYKKLRSAVFHRRMLIIIDDVWDAKHAMHFNIAGPYSRTLLTTRELPVAYELATRERTLRVDLLSPKDALDLLRHLSPETVATDVENAQRLCARLEYLPLALTLAGRLLAYEAEVPSRMQRMVDELIERRAARLHLLQSEGRLGLQTEEVSLQAILGLSVERLSRTDQELFAMLSVFGGDPLTCEIQAIAHVWQCSLLEAEAAISRLIQRGLVERRNDRYWMHALLADYAAEMREEMKL